LRLDLVSLYNNTSVSIPGASSIRRDDSPSEVPFWNGMEIPRLVDRLDALLMVLKTCKGRQCTHPWESLFPNGGVKSLLDTLDPSFDEFFEKKVEKVKFEKCEKGYIAESEGPVWDSSQVYGMFEEMAFE
jgi:hypothetical protein